MFACCKVPSFKYEIFSLMLLLEEDRDQGGTAQHSLEMGFFCSIYRRKRILKSHVERF